MLIRAFVDVVALVRVWERDWLQFENNCNLREKNNEKIIWKSYLEKNREKKKSNLVVLEKIGSI